MNDLVERKADALQKAASNLLRLVDGRMKFGMEHFTCSICGKSVPTTYCPESRTDIKHTPDCAGELLQRAIMEYFWSKSGIEKVKWED